MPTFTAVGEVRSFLRLGMFHPEDGSNPFLQNVGNYLPLFVGSF
jgi:hypothetical protein